MKNDVLQGYGVEHPSLQEILEMLCVHCQMAGASNPSIKVILPKVVQDQFTLNMTAKERFTTNQNPTQNPKITKTAC